MARNSIKNSKTPTFRTAPVKAPAKPAVSSEFTSLGGHWCTIESSPAVFNALVEKNGIRGAYVKEVWSLEPELFDLFKKDTVVYGFIFLLRPQAHRLSKIEFMVTDDDGGLDSWSFQVGNSQSNKEDLGDNGQRSGGTEQKDRKTGIYFANQVIPDACGTQALLSIAMNSPGLDIGPMLYNFKDFTARFDPKDKGLAMTNSKQLRDNHNSLSGYYEREPNLPLPFLENADSSMEQAAGTMNEEHLDEKRASPGRGGQRQTQLNELEETQEEYDDQFHYVAYVPSAGFIWELDGLQPGPLRLMPCTDDSWLDAARIEIIARMKSYGDAEDHFVLLAVVKDPLPILLEKLELLKSSKERQALGTSTSIDDHEAQHQEHKPKEEDILADQIKQVETEIQMIKEERAMQQREVQEAEADFRDAVSIFMKAFVNL